MSYYYLNGTGLISTKKTFEKHNKELVYGTVLLYKKIFLNFKIYSSTKCFNLQLIN